MVALGYGRHKVGKGSLGLRPIRIAEAQEYMLGGSRSIHRHHEKSQGGLYAISVVRGEPAGERVVAVAVVGRPVARKLQNSEPGTIEVIRLASDGTPHAPSMLLGAVERAARALGWRSLITYTLPSESGASLRAASWQVDRESAGGGHWGTVARPRVTKHPVDLKVRWRKALRTESAPTRPGAPRHATRSPFDAPWWSETGLDLFDVFDLADEVT